MTSTSIQTLEIKHDKLDPAALSAIRKIQGLADASKIKYFIAGATAREIMLRHVFGRAPGRRTLDVDFGIAVDGWEQFETLKSTLISKARFLPHRKQKQRLIEESTGIVVDLMPFGGVERPDETIAWPPEEEIVMRVSGFKDALIRAVQVRLDAELIVPVISLPLLLVLKLFAWMDRKAEKRDAEDIYTLLREYGDAGNEDRLFGEHLEILESEEFNFELAGAVLLGRDTASSISSATHKQLSEILNSNGLMTELSDQMMLLSRGLERDTAKTCELLIEKLRLGFFAFRG